MKIIEQFLDTSLPKQAWTHHAHLAVGLWHLLAHTPTESLLLMRCRIIAYNNATNTPNTLESGYHETLTYFWLWAIQEFLKTQDRQEPFEQLLQKLLASPFGDRALPFRYFDRNRLFSIEGRGKILAFDESIGVW